MTCAVGANTPGLFASGLASLHDRHALKGQHTPSMHHTGTDYATLASSYQHTKPAVQHMQVPQLSARTLDKTEAPSYKTHCVRCSGCSKLPVSTLDLPAQPLALPAHTRPAKVQLASAADAWCIPGWRASALKLNKVHTVNTRVHAATGRPAGL